MNCVAPSDGARGPTSGLEFITGDRVPLTDRSIRNQGLGAHAAMAIGPYPICGYGSRALRAYYKLDTAMQAVCR